MRLLDEAKQFFWLRRIALALERQNEIYERIIRAYELEQPHPKPPRRKNEMDVMDLGEVEKEWLRRMEAERDGVELED